MSDKVDINEADAAVLALLPGIGAKLAERIVLYRTNVHPFEEVIELAAVPGISERMVREIAGQLTVNGAEGEGAALIRTEEEVVTVERVEAVDDEPLEEAAEEAVVVQFLPVERPEPEPEPDVPGAAGEVGGNRAERVTERVAAESAVERAAVSNAPRRHVHFWQQLFGVAAGALFGSLLTLLLLYLLNGTLRYAGDSRTTTLQLQVDEETSAIRQSQSSLADELGGLSGRVVELGNEQAKVEDRVAGVETEVSELESETAALSEQVETINLTAEKFDAFLSGLRDLLVTLQGLPVGPTATVTITATGTITVSATPVGTAGTPTPSATAATPEGNAPTRTPRPTATPILE